MGIEFYLARGLLEVCLGSGARETRYSDLSRPRDQLYRIGLQFTMSKANTNCVIEIQSPFTLYRKGQPEYEIKWSAAHNTWEPITNLAGYEGMVEKV